ncbi:Oidioi.mRNA.OKI2018_I69.chr2.g5596.t1.cds [Oikopleura dioica]|uniref:Oidioi.mRNA.OKI2018_I69.chr2.g5596.t1.cds n=1 Tax=Oikopleura dioica TaxID=34765 RepID=A0ABN7T7D3_OIKDI|nr:Oidioi.mRNA.OKI2018_I69.chr2.g5596.t1.cds [Oikopleura dioica]
MLEQERKAKSESFKFEEIPYQRKRETMMKIPQNTFGDRKTAIYETSGGRITIAGDALSTHGSMHRSTRAFKSSRTTRMTFIQAASSTTDSVYSMSHIGSMSREEIANAIAGVGKAGLVNLQSDVRFNKVRLPKKSDFTLKGLDKVKRYAWLVLLQNGFATFCAGMVIAASFYISLAEGIIIAFSFIWQETLHRCGDYITLIKNGVNPLQSMFFIFLSSIMVIPGAILGMYISHDHQEQWIFALGCGYFMYNSFGIVLPELDEAEARSVWLEAKPMKPFILQNSGLAAGFIICAVFAYVEFEIDWKW